MTVPASSSSCISFPRHGAMWQDSIFVDILDSCLGRDVGVNGGDGTSFVRVGDERPPISVLHQRSGMSQDEKAVLGSRQSYVHTLLVGQEA